MSNSSVVAALPNPNTPLAFLPPDVANELEVYRYFAVATLGAFTWNTLAHADTHYKLLFRNRITLATVAYFTSIIGTAVYICCCVAFHVGAIRNCQALTTALASACVFTFPAISVLFLLRIFAVFSGHRAVTGFFVFCWLGVVGSAITMPFALFGAHIGPTSHCIDSGVKPFSSAATISSTVFDSLVFLFITGSLLNNAMTGDTFRDKMKTFFGGAALPALSRALLYSGQVYYLITMCANIATAVLILSPSVPPLYHALLTTPNSALTCMMACKVYRDVKFGSHTGNSDLSFPSRRFTQASSPPSDQAPIRAGKQTFIDVFTARKEESMIQDSRESFPPSHTSSNGYFEA